MTDPAALREALAEAIANHDDICSRMAVPECADAILAHPAVAAALAGSGPEAGLRDERIRKALDSLDVIDGIVDDTHPEGDGCPLCVALDDLRAALAGSGPAAGLREAVDAARYTGPRADENPYWRGFNHGINALRDALAATPTASPTDPEPEWVGTFRAASPTATGEAPSD